MQECASSLQLDRSFISSRFLLLLGASWKRPLRRCACSRIRSVTCLARSVVLAVIDPSSITSRPRIAILGLAWAAAAVDVTMSATRTLRAGRTITGSRRILNENRATRALYTQGYGPGREMHLAHYRLLF